MEKVLFKSKAEREKERAEKREYLKFMKQYDLTHNTDYSNTHYLFKTKKIREKEKRGMEIYRNIVSDYDKALKAVFPNGNDEFTANKVRREMSEMRDKDSKKFERMYYFKLVVFTPLIKIFNVLSVGLKISTALSVFAFFYGIFLTGQKIIMNTTTNNLYIILLLVSPFVISILMFGSENLAYFMQSEIGENEE